MNRKLNKVIKCILIVFFLTVSKSSYSYQNKTLDSLRAQLKNSDVALENKINLLIELGELLNDIDTDSAIIINKLAISESKRIKNDSLLADAYRGLGISYINKGLYKEGLDKTLNSLEISKRLNLSNQIRKALSNIAVTYIYMNDYAKASSTLQKVKKYLESNNIEQWRDFYMNSGILFWNQKKLDSAIKAYDSALFLSNKLNHYREIAIISHNIASLKRDMEDYSGSIHYYRRSIEINDSLGFKTHIPAAYISLGKSYFLLNRFKESESTLKMGIKKALKENLQNIASTGYYYLYELYEGQNLYELALKNYIDYNSINDSIRDSNFSAKIDNLHYKYISREKEYENQVLRNNVLINDKKLSYRTNLLIITCIFMAVLFIALYKIFVLYRVKKVSFEKLLSSNKKIKLQSELLEKNSKQLEIAMKEINFLNQALEEKIEQKEALIKTKNKAIIKYSELNAHSVRAPLARIIGLLTILDHSSNPQEKEDLIKMIQFEATDLNNIIYSIKDLLETEEFMKIKP